MFSQHLFFLDKPYFRFCFLIFYHSTPLVVILLRYHIFKMVGVIPELEKSIEHLLEYIARGYLVEEVHG